MRRGQPVEVETDPSKNLRAAQGELRQGRVQVGRVRFVVLSRIRRSRRSRGFWQDKDRNTFETVVRGAGLPKDQTARLISEDARALLKNVTEGNPRTTRRLSLSKPAPEGEEGQAEAPQASGDLTPLRKERSCGFWAKSAGPAIPAGPTLASDVDVTVRQVTRYLDALEASEPAEEGRERVRAHRWQGGD